MGGRGGERRPPPPSCDGDLGHVSTENTVKAALGRRRRRRRIFQSFPNLNTHRAAAGGWAEGVNAAPRPQAAMGIWGMFQPITQIKRPWGGADGAAAFSKLPQLEHSPGSGGRMGGRGGERRPPPPSCDGDLGHVSTENTVKAALGRRRRRRRIFQSFPNLNTHRAAAGGWAEGVNAAPRPQAAMGIWGMFQPITQIKRPWGGAAQGGQRQIVLCM